MNGDKGAHHDRQERSQRQHKGAVGPTAGSSWGLAGAGGSACGRGGGQQVHGGA